MKKRTFLQAVLASGGVALVGKHYLDQYLLDPNGSGLSSSTSASAPPTASPAATAPLTKAGHELVETTAAEEQKLIILSESEMHPDYVHHEHNHASDAIVEQMPQDQVDDYLAKIRNFDADFKSDLFLDEANSLLLVPTVARLERVQDFVGHANFNLLSFKEMLYFARNYEQIGAFTKAELDFMEEIFYNDATEYGFFGDKVSPTLDHQILQKDVAKIHGSGHFLHKGESLNHYNQIRKDVGNELLLTSGIRNNVKQMHLFLAKARASNGNLSKASRSLAPPGYSFHNAGDFDVGKIGLGEENFTSSFSHTEEFQRLIRLGYVDIRYTDSNQFGVRYEPWHIKLG